MEFTSPAGAGVIQGAHDFQLNNSSINVVGGDSHAHTHVHYQGTPNDLKAVLNTIDNFRKIQQDTLAKATPGTVEWLFIADYFTTWWDKNGEAKMLWGSGIPGAGKTIIASLVINKIEHRAAERADQICVAYFYMRYSEHGEVTVRAVLQVLVKQTLERHENLLPFAEQVYARHIREGTQPTELQLLSLLRQFNAHMTITFYILDALDEAPIDIQHDLIDKLASLNARILITSRPMQDVQACFPEARCFKIAAHNRDLDLHIADKLQGSPRLRSLLDRAGASVKQRVISTVKSKCGGMFLHASLQLDALGRCLNVSGLKRTLDLFPAKIEDVYTQTWERIVKQDSDHAALAKLALVWVLYAQRSLTIEELLRAIAICPETHSFEEERLVSESTITDLCFGLIMVDDRSRLVRLVHYTAKQPMEDLLRTPFPHPHSLLAVICVARLADFGFQNTIMHSDKELDMALRLDPRFSFAYDSWVHHTQESLDVDFATSRVSAFVAGCRAFPVALSVIELRHDFNPFYQRQLDTFGPLHIVAFYNLPIAFAGPHNSAHDANARTARYKLTPLHLACCLGHYAAVFGLLYLPGILANVSHDEGETILGTACWKGYKDVVKLLLSHPDTEVNLADDVGDTPLTIASDCGYKGIVKLLLAHPDIDVNLADCKGDTSLIIASARGNKGVVQLLLAHPNVDINLSNRYGTTALMAVVRLRFHDDDSKSIVKLLLAHPNINANLADVEGATAMFLASYNGHVGAVRHLLAVPDIDVNAVNDFRNTAIKMAAQEGHEGVVRVLLEAPAINPSVESIDGQTAMSTAVARCHHAIVRLLEEFESRDTTLHSSSEGAALETSLLDETEVVGLEQPRTVVPIDAAGDREVERKGGEPPSNSDSDGSELYEDAPESPSVDVWDGGMGAGL